MCRYCAIWPRPCASVASTAPERSLSRLGGDSLRGRFAVALVVWLRAVPNSAVQRSEARQEKDRKAVIAPLLPVVLFALLLTSLV